MNQRQRRAAELKLRSALRAELLEELPVNEHGEQICPKCLRKPDWRGFQMVHKVSLGRGGKTTRDNCAIWCTPCHFGPDGHRTEGMR